MDIKAVIFDMYETLITQYRNEPYFTGNIAKDAGIEEKSFRKYWSVTEEDRTLGRASLKGVTGSIMQRFNCYSKERLDYIYSQRIKSKSEQFNHLHSEILPMLKALKENNIKTGIISNCYLEEAEVIENSLLYPYFDVVVLSCREGIQKPELKIYNLCMERLNILPKNCLYAGDGGCRELYGAKEAGMNTFQACWYIKEWQDDYRQKEFEAVYSPMEIVNIISGQDT